MSSQLDINCIQGRKALIVCITRNCQNNAFSCETSKCRCEQLHRKCTKDITLRKLLMNIGEKKSSINNDQQIVQIGKIFESIMSQIENQYNEFKNFIFKLKNSNLGTQFRKKLQNKQTKNLVGDYAHSVYQSTNNSGQQKKVIVPITSRQKSLIQEKVKQLRNLLVELYAISDKKVQDEQQIYSREDKGRRQNRREHRGRQDKNNQQQQQRQQKERMRQRRRQTKIQRQRQRQQQRQKQKQKQRQRQRERQRERQRDRQRERERQRQQTDRLKKQAKQQSQQNEHKQRQRRYDHRNRRQQKIQRERQKQPQQPREQQPRRQHHYNNQKKQNNRNQQHKYHGKPPRSIKKKIKDIAPEDNHLSLIVKIISVEKNSYKGKGRAHINCQIGDQTGVSNGRFQISELIKPGSQIEIINGYAKVYHGHIQIQCGRMGKIEEAKTKIQKIDIKNNISAKTYIQVKQNNQDN